jgi:glucose/mannose-6-phosphate isomerase
MQMDQLIADFSEHLREALAISITFSTDIDKTFDNVVITGLGGSGIGGKIVNNIVASEVNIPVVCNNDYALPNFVGKNTLLIAASYSGGTEETLEALEEGISKGCTCAIVSSGGKAIEIAKEKNIDHIIIPGGLPPRAAFGYSFVQLFTFLHAYAITSVDRTEAIDKAIELLDSEENNIRSLAKDLAAKLYNKQAVIYSSFAFEGVSTRFRQQLNENSKVLTWHHCIPEMNHNELVGWAGGGDNHAVINFMNPNDHFKTKERFRISKEIISRYTNNIFDLEPKGESLLEHSLYFIHLGDWISYELSVLYKVDPVEVDVITHLKTELGKL